MSLCGLQRQLERIYRVQVEHHVDDFLITDAELACQLDNSDNARAVKEKLLVRQDDGDLDLALYLDADVVAQLQRQNPAKCLHDGNLEAFLLALEGVSHFLYVIWNAGLQKSVTLLELELQAEIDKYITSAFLLGQQLEGHIPGMLHGKLFDAASFDERLSPEERERYHSAHRYAGKYCWQLENRYRYEYGGSRMMEELRHFYRLTQGEKIRRINHC